MSPQHTAIWVEDEPETVERHLPVLEKLGITCDIKHVSELKDMKIKNRKYDIGIFDGKLGAGHDGVYHARVLADAGTINSVLLVTRFLKNYAGAEHQFDPRIPFRVVPKSDMARASVALEKAEPIHDLLLKTGIPDILEAMESDSHRASNRLEAPVFEAPRDHLASVREFYSMPVNVQLDLLDKIHDTYRPYVDAMFEERPDVAWIVLGAPTGEILEWGDAQTEGPRTRQRIETLARQAVGPACVPFNFTRPTFRIS